MTRVELKEMPWLLSDRQVIAVTGYAVLTLRKLVDCAVLATVQPAGCEVRRFRKAQVALLLGMRLEELGAEGFRCEPLLMGQKGVWVWTGYDKRTVGKIVAAGGIHVVRPPGMSHGKYRKEEVGELIGLGRYL